MGLFSRPETVIIKEGSSARMQLAALESLRGTLPKRAEKQLETDIRNVKAGIAGEERIMYELKNSHMDLFVLQDLFLEHDGLTAQIDFLVLTTQRFFVLECKNLYGNIEINDKGDFIRTFRGGKKEGIYSPITQNKRHIDLIHALKRDSRSLAINLLVDKDFDDVYRPLVVLANPKTVLNDRCAKSEVKKQLVRADQLVAIIKAINREKGPGRDAAFKSTVQKNAEWFLEQHVDMVVDYAEKYRELATIESEENQQEAAPAPVEYVAAPRDEVAAAAPAPASNAAAAQKAIMCPRCGATMVLRTAKRGKRAGKQFYGCSNYPACYGIVNVGE